MRGGLCSSDQAAGIAEREKEEVGQPDLWYCEEKSSDAVTVVCVCVPSPSDSLLSQLVKAYTTNLLQGVRCEG